MKNLFARFIREEEGQDAAEYALLLLLISVTIYGIVQTLGQTINSVYTTANTQLSGGS